MGLGGCPLPILRRSDGPVVPARLRVTNDTPGPLAIYIDTCRGHLRTGVVQAGRTSVLRLPRTLYPYRESLRIHTYAEERSERYATYLVPLADAALLDFTLTPDGALPERELGLEIHLAQPSETAARAPAAPPALVFHELEGTRNLTVWSVDQSATATWTCGAQDLRVQIAGPDLAQLTDPVTVAVVGGREAGGWELERGEVQVLHGAAEAARVLAEEGGDGSGLSLRIRGGGGALHLTFVHPELAEALVDVDCLEG